MICTGETYKTVVKLTFAKGASLKDPSGLFNSSPDGNAGAQSTSTRAKRSTRTRQGIDPRGRGLKSRRAATKRETKRDKNISHTPTLAMAQRGPEE